MSKERKIKPRNHVVIAALQRAGGAGSHRKGKKAKRFQGKMDLYRELRSM